MKIGGIVLESLIFRSQETDLQILQISTLCHQRSYPDNMLSIRAVIKMYVHPLQFSRNAGKGNEETDMWIAYCAFHLGDYKRAMEVFLYNLIKYLQEQICQLLL